MVCFIFFLGNVAFRYCPIIPTVLVNGTEGIGTAWSTKVPNHNPRDLVENVRRMIRGDEPRPVVSLSKTEQIPYQ